ncbi:MAG: AAA family ATPase [Solirubrobacterales bacterium]|nr:AAA family ATPase [Solirubrobacterales bacterium]
MGRLAELEALQQLLQRAAAGTGGVILVAGEAGIGKSRLVAEFETRARAAGALVLIGECVELAEGELAFSPIIAALRRVMEDAEAIEGLSGPLRSALAGLWPGAGPVEGVVGGREQLFEAVYRVLARLAERRPVLLIVEDVHWIDRSSRDLLAFLARNARRDAIALAATYRPDALHKGHPLRPFVAELEQSGRAKRVEVKPLARPEVAEQLQAIAGHVPDGRVIEQIFSRSEGNPFFAEELLAETQSGSGQLPASLREILLLRVERLSAVTREVLQAAAVAGRSVDHRLLADVVGVQESQLVGALREATDRHVLVPGVGGMTYSFRHALLREAVYDDALPAERLWLHRAIAETLTAHREYAGPAAAAELAHHWHAAGEESAALAASLPAADEAERMRAYGEAHGHVERALALWDRVDAPGDASGTDRVELLLRASKLAEFSGDAARGLELAEQARAAIDDRAEPRRAAAAEMRIGRSMHFAGRGVDALEHLAAARTLVPREPPSLEYAEVLAAEGRALMLNGRMREAKERLEEAVPITRRLAAPTVEAGALCSLAFAYSNLGARERAIATGREAIRIAEATGSPDEIVRAYINGSQAIDNAGLIEEALALGVEGVSAADRLGMSRGPGDQLRQQAAWRLQRIGRLSAAERMLAPALENATTPFNIAASRCFAGRLAVERGDLDLAQNQLEEAWALMQRSGGFQLIGPATAARVLLDIRRGDLHRARERAADGLERAAAAPGDLMYNAELYWLAARVEAELAEHARASSDDQALRASERAAIAAVDALGETISQVPGDGAPPESVAFEALAMAELARARAERVPGPWSVAAQRFRAIGAIYPAAYAEFHAAEALALAGGRPAEIAVPLKAAYAVALEVDSPPFLDQVVGLARRTGVPLGDRVDDGAGDIATELGLSNRELEVLRLLAEGRTNRQIGERLFITPKTASAHVSHILMKLGVTNRGEAAAAAHRLGLTGAVRVD